MGITSLFAAYLGAKIQKTGEKKITDYSNIFVNLDGSIDVNDDQLITSEPGSVVYSRPLLKPLVRWKNGLHLWSKYMEKRWNSTLAVLINSSA